MLLLLRVQQRFKKQMFRNAEGRDNLTREKKHRRAPCQRFSDIPVALMEGEAKFVPAFFVLQHKDQWSPKFW
jgi:hypothetical protein